jgi:putative spermidine/putrescine transport system permease protein
VPALLTARLTAGRHASSLQPDPAEPALSPRLRLALLLAPVVCVTGGLFLAALGTVVARSLATPQPFGAYRAILADPGFLRSLALTLWIAAASTLIACAIALPAALLLRRRFPGRGTIGFLFQLNLTIPHVVGAMGILWLLGQSGLIARAAFHAGVIARPADFPALVQDPFAFGIILHYVWKEVPFIGLILLSQLQTLGDDLAGAARSLGATRWQAFRHVTLPLILPGLLSAAVIVFAFAFATFEVPLLLGASHPQTLPVIAWQAWTDTDLAARPQAMAMAAVMTAITALLALALLRLQRR